MTDSPLISGWAMPGLAKKFHYFDEGQITSICGKWAYSGIRDSDGNKPSANAGKSDCAACFRLRTAMLKDQL